MNGREGRIFEKNKFLVNWDNFETNKDNKKQDKNKRRASNYQTNNMQKNNIDNNQIDNKPIKSENNSPTNTQNLLNTKKLEGSLPISDQLDTNKKIVRLFFEFANSHILLNFNKTRPEVLMNIANRI